MKRYILLILTLYVTLSLSAQMHHETRKGELDIYLLIGQSNMAGRAEIEFQDRDTLDGILLFTGIESSMWEPATNPLNKYSAIRKGLEMQKLGPGYSFAKYMKKYFPNQKVGLVVNARGGTSVNEWLPGSMFFNESLGLLTLASEHGEIKGVLWHQGESDVSKSENYIENIIGIIEAIRLETGVVGLPFVVGELSEDNPDREYFNKMLRTLPEKISNVQVVSSAGTATFDGTHFDSGSQRLMGDRFAKAMILLLETP